MKEILKLALEALEVAQDNLRDHGDNCFLHDEGEYNRCFCGKDSLSDHLQSVVEKLDEALAHPEQEPWGDYLKEGETPFERFMRERKDGDALLSLYRRAVAENEQLKAHPEQEPVAWGMPSAGGGFIVDCITPEEHDRVEGGYTVPLYTTPPPVPLAHKRTWVGLTVDELHRFSSFLDWKSDAEVFELIEAKLKEKNT